LTYQIPALPSDEDGQTGKRRMPMIPSVDVTELKESLKNRNIKLLDVRRKDDYDTSPKKIPGAIWLDPKTVDTWIDTQDTNKFTVVYCVKGGGVSQSVAEQMQQNGIQTAFLKGGLKAWSENGEPVE
jgi:rhodanese-related sulfurtransferase